MSVDEGVRDDSLDAEQDPNIGRTIGGRFEIVSQLGTGGMGRVYEAIQYPVGRRVALKVLKASLQENDRFLARFEREAQAIAHLNHPNIVTLYDFGVDPSGDTYIAMEYVEGRLLTLFLREEVDTDFTLHITSQVLAALQTAHEEGIVHRDLKPDNIMLTTVGGDDVFVKVLDFGLAHLATDAEDVAITAAGEVFGTPLYMSPEQATGDDISPATDLYSLGCIMYELLAGRPPFRGTRPMNVLMKHVNAPVPDLIPKQSIIPSKDLLDIVMRCLEKMPEDRYATANEMLEAIYRLPEGGQLTRSVPSLLQGEAPAPEQLMETRDLSGEYSARNETDEGLADTVVGQSGELPPDASEAPSSEPSAVKPEPPTTSTTSTVFVVAVVLVVIAAVVASLAFREEEEEPAAPEASETSAEDDAQRNLADAAVFMARKKVSHATNKAAHRIKLEFVVFGRFREALSDPAGANPGRGINIRRPLGTEPWYQLVDEYHRKQLTTTSYVDPIELVFGD